MNAFLKLLEEKKHPLIMSMPVNDPAIVEAAFQAGADAVKVHVNLLHHASERQFGGVKQHKAAFDEMFANRRGPLGVVLGNAPAIVEETWRETLAYPFDFVSLYARHMPVSLLEQPAAKMIACDGGNTLEEIARFGEFGVGVLEASVIPGEEYGAPLQLMDLIRYRAICAACGVPVVVPTQRAIRPDELKPLFETGVRGIMIGAIVTGNEKASIVRAVEAFRAAIDRL